MSMHSTNPAGAAAAAQFKVEAPRAHDGIAFALGSAFDASCALPDDMLRALSQIDHATRQHARR